MNHHELLDRLEAAEKENIKLREALAEKVISETVLRDLSVGNGSINASFEGGAVHLFVDSLANQFVESGAVNYLEMRFHSEATGPLLLTLQRADGKTPHQLRVEAEQERGALLAALQHETDCLEAAKDKIDALRAEIEELHVLIAAVKKQANAEFCLRVKKEEEYAQLRAKIAAEI